jgi:hypothetical protein
MKTPPFNSKETYLAYRSAWKAEYKTLSAEIRTLRLADRFHQRSQFARLAFSAADQRCLAAATTLCESATFDSSLAALHRRRRSTRATELLAELKEAKLEAQRQYLARKAGEALTPLPGT